MDKKKLQLSIIIGSVAILLVIVLLVGILLLPSSTTTPPVSGGEEVVTPVTIAKYDITGRIFGTDGNPLANTKFSISLGPTDFTTDENGFFILKNLPVGKYTLSGYDMDGNRIGTTVFQLSSDGVFTIGSYSFAKEELITLCFDGEKFFAVKVTENVGSSNNTVTPVKKKDETYTNFSWMKDIPREYGAYNLDYYWNRELLDGVLADEEFEYFNTFIVAGSNPNVMKKSVEAVVKDGKKVWLSVYNLIYNGEEKKAENLKGDWREILDEYCTMVKIIAGDLFQGVYFDEPSHHMTDMDYTRVTQYIRETYNCRVWSVHASPAYITPYYKQMNILTYRAGRDDPMIINADNHAYTTDVGFWKYGGPRWYGDSMISAQEFKKAMTLLDPNTRVWIVPVFGAYDWRHNEDDCLDVQYMMMDSVKELPNFGGIMLYSMWHGSAYDACAEITEEKYSKETGNGRLEDDDYLMDEKGNYILDDEGNRIVHVKENHSPVPLPDHFVEGYGAYYVYDKLPDGSIRWPRVKQYIDIMGEGIHNNTPWSEVLEQMAEIYTPDPSRFKNNMELEDT